MWWVRTAHTPGDLMIIKAVSGNTVFAENDLNASLEFFFCDSDIPGDVQGQAGAWSSLDRGRGRNEGGLRSFQPKPVWNSMFCCKSECSDLLQEVQGWV